MAFDLAWDFRDTLAYVTDPSYAVGAITGHAYPHTYTNGDGYSLNAGWTTEPSPLNSDNTNDPRIAGSNYNFGTGVTKTFQIDLSSGSAPGAATYAIDMAFGDAVFGNTQAFQIKDDSTVLISTAGIATAADHYIDATLSDVAATSLWTGTPVNKTFASTTAYIVLNPAGAAVFTTLAHFRLTLATAGSAATRSMLMLLGVGV